MELIKSNVYATSCFDKAWKAAERAEEDRNDEGQENMTTVLKPTEQRPGEDTAALYDRLHHAEVVRARPDGHAEVGRDWGVKRAAEARDPHGRDCRSRARVGEEPSRKCRLLRENAHGRSNCALF